MKGGVVSEHCSGGRAVLSMLASILEAEEDLPFAAALVQALNLILLTAPEARPNYSVLCVPCRTLLPQQALEHSAPLRAAAGAQSMCHSTRLGWTF